MGPAGTARPTLPGRCGASAQGPRIDRRPRQAGGVSRAVGRLVAGMAIGMAVPASAADLQLRLDPAAPAVGQPLRFEAQIAGASGFGLGGLQPRGWLLPREGPGACAAPPAGSGARPVDGRWLLTLQADHTLAAIDLQRRWAGSHIAWLARLPEAPSAWHLDRERSQALVALPDAGELRWISLAHGREQARLRSGLGRPSALVDAAEAGGWWVLDAAGPRLIWLGARSPADPSATPDGTSHEAGRPPAPPPPPSASASASASPASIAPAWPALALDGLPQVLHWVPERRELWVASGTRLQVVGPGARLRREWRLASPARALAHSALAGALYVARGDGAAAAGEIEAFDLDEAPAGPAARSGRAIREAVPAAAPAVPAAPPRASTPVARAAERLLASRDGRWLIALDEDDGVVTVIDAATHRPRHVLRLHAGIADARLSAGYLYLRERERAYTSLVRLASLAEREPHVFAVPTGTRGGPGALAPLGDDGMAVVDADEGVAYLYMESGMADGHGAMRSPTEMLNPYEALRLRVGRVVGVDSWERGFVEQQPGRFSAGGPPAEPGAWRLVVREARSDSIACLDFDVAGPRVPRAPGVAGRAPPWRLSVESAQLDAGAVDGATEGAAAAGWRLHLLDGRGAVLPARAAPQRLALRVYRTGHNAQRELKLARADDGAYLLPLAALQGLAPSTAGAVELQLVPLGTGFDGARPLSLEWRR